MKKVLIVEDEPTVITLISTIMEGENYQILTAKDGQEALEVTRSEKPDLIILDLMLPIIDGWEVCRQLKEAPETKSIYILVLTARAQEKDRLRAQECGADEYIVKPFSPLQLLSKVKEILKS